MQEVIVSVETEFLPEESKFHNESVWTYFITIKNDSDKSVQLLSRHWLITDGNGENNEVMGDGVVGLQPIIKPKSSFKYNSFLTSKTGSSIMSGTYSMIDEENNEFKIMIPMFFLETPINA